MSLSGRSRRYFMDCVASDVNGDGVDDLMVSQPLLTTLGGLCLGQACWHHRVCDFVFRAGILEGIGGAETGAIHVLMGRSGCVQTMI